MGLIAAIVMSALAVGCGDGGSDAAGPPVTDDTTAVTNSANSTAGTGAVGADDAEAKTAFGEIETDDQGVLTASSLCALVPTEQLGPLLGDSFTVSLSDSKKSGRLRPSSQPEAPTCTYQYRGKFRTGGLSVSAARPGAGQTPGEAFDAEVAYRQELVSGQDQVEELAIGDRAVVFRAVSNLALLQVGEHVLQLSLGSPGTFDLDTVKAVLERFATALAS